MPKNTAMPTAWRISEPAPEEMTSGSTPRMNANEVIRIGRSRSRQASTTASVDVPPLLLLLLGEFDDQDRVLRRQSDQHDEADLGQHVDVLRHEPDAERCRQTGTSARSG